MDGGAAGGLATAGRVGPRRGVRCTWAAGGDSGNGGISRPPWAISDRAGDALAGPGRTGPPPARGARHRAHGARVRTPAGLSARREAATWERTAAAQEEPARGGPALDGSRPGRHGPGAGNRGHAHAPCTRGLAHGDWSPALRGPTPRIWSLPPSSWSPTPSSPRPGWHGLGADSGGHARAPYTQGRILGAGAWGWGREGWGWRGSFSLLSQSRPSHDP